LKKAGEGNNSNQFKSLGRTGSGKIGAFLPKYYYGDIFHCRINDVVGRVREY